VKDLIKVTLTGVSNTPVKVVPTPTKRASLPPPPSEPEGKPIEAADNLPVARPLQVVLPTDRYNRRHSRSVERYRGTPRQPSPSPPPPPRLSGDTWVSTENPNHHHSHVESKSVPSPVNARDIASKYEHEKSKTRDIERMYERGISRVISDAQWGLRKAVRAEDAKLEEVSRRVREAERRRSDVERDTEERKLRAEEDRGHEQEALQKAKRHREAVEQESKRLEEKNKIATEQLHSVNQARQMVVRRQRSDLAGTFNRHLDMIRGSLMAGMTKLLSQKERESTLIDVVKMTSALTEVQTADELNKLVGNSEKLGGVLAATLMAVGSHQMSNKYSDRLRSIDSSINDGPEVYLDNLFGSAAPTTPDVTALVSALVTTNRGRIEEKKTKNVTPAPRTTTTTTQQQQQQQPTTGAADDDVAEGDGDIIPVLRDTEE
jgi:hypothetical protein